MISRELEILNEHVEQQTLIFTDGSVVGCTVAWGACSVVLFPTDGREDNVQTATMAVGVKVSSKHCDIEGIIFGRPFVKQFALCYRTVVLSCLSVTLVYCGQAVGWIKMKLGMQAGLGTGHVVLDGDPGPPLPKGHSPQFSAYIFSGQMVRWIKMPLRRKVSLNPSDTVLDGDPASPPQKGAEPPNFWPMFVVAKRLD